MPTVQNGMSPDVKTSTPYAGHHRQFTNRTPQDQYRPDSIRTSIAPAFQEEQHYNVHRPGYQRPETFMENARRSVERILRTKTEDRSFILAHNKMINDFIQGDLTTLKSPAYNSYERYIVHQMATMHGLLHFVDKDGHSGNRKPIILRKNEDHVPVMHNVQVYMLHRGIYTSFEPLRVDIQET
jgi:hypothetical protein